MQSTERERCSELRIHVLKLYTSGNAWHSWDEQDLGTIELGKLADLAVLSANPLMVSDDAFRTIKSVLTMQGDRIVHLA